MKKLFLPLMILGMLAFSACDNKDEDVIDNAVVTTGTNPTPDDPSQETTTPVTNFPKTISAGFAENRDTDAISKLAIEGSPETSFQYVFQKGDMVTLLHGYDMAVYINTAEDGASATFELDGTYPGMGMEKYLDDYVAMTCSFELPDDNIVLLADSDRELIFSYDHLFVSRSESEPTELKFYTLNSFLMIANDSDYEFEMIEFSGNSSEVVAGKYLVNDFVGYTLEEYDNKDVDWDQHTITIYEPGNSIKKNSNYFIPLIPGTFEKGYTLKCYTKDGSMFEYKVNKSVEFKRNEVRGARLKWKNTTPSPLNKSQMHSTIPYDEATSIIFGKKSEYSDVSLVDYADEAQLIGVYTSTTDQDAYYVLSENDGEVMAPEDCSGLFNEYSNLKTLSLNNFNTANVTNMFAMFYGCSGLTNLTLDDNFNTANVTNMHSMFSGCSGLTNLTLGDKFNTANVSDMGGMFSGCSGLTNLTLGDKFNTANVTDMSEMFYGCSNLKTIYATDKFTTDKVAESYGMFDGCASLVGGMGTKYNSSKTDKSYAKIDGGASAPGYFTLKSNLSIEKENDKNVDGWD